MTRPVIPWMGGKRRLVKHILPLLGPHVCYCEPFVGGGAVFFYKELSQVEVINDLHSDLVTLYRVLKHHLDEFVRHFRWALVSRAAAFLEGLDTDTVAAIAAGEVDLAEVAKDVLRCAG